MKFNCNVESLLNKTCKKKKKSLTFFYLCSFVLCKKIKKKLKSSWTFLCISWSMAAEVNQYFKGLYRVKDGNK